MATGGKTILVTGDIVVDHSTYRGTRAAPGSQREPGTLALTTLGGAGLLHGMVQALVAQPHGEPGAGPAVHVRFGLRGIAYAGLPPHLHCHAVWEPRDGVWRLTHRLGYGSPPSEAACCPVQPSASADDAADIVVLDDGGLGYRSSLSRDAWPRCLRDRRTKRPEWLVLKMSSPVCQGDLWRALDPQLRRKLVVVVSVDDLRREEVHVTAGISWERTVTDLVNELSCNAAIRDLRLCRHLVVSFGTEGALHVDYARPDKPTFQLVFDPEHMEDEWGRGIEGDSLGYMSCLTAGIVRQLVASGKSAVLAEGIRAGLSVMRESLRLGHGPVEKKDENGNVVWPQPALAFDALAKSLKAPRDRYAVRELAGPPGDGARLEGYWTLLSRERGRKTPMYGLAKRIALVGPKAVGSVPYARFGKLMAVDRSEVESLRIIRRLIRDYEDDREVTRPLSIAVFGPPGAGKSFGVKQIAKGMHGNDTTILEFNLSQFSEPQELNGLFHQVRDEVLKGRTPFVFWDEFDSRRLFWLQYFLAPMQDGTFQDGQITHPIGRCVFIFAGGTSHDMESFAPPEDPKDAWESFKLLKGPDFCSRLSGYMNVLGPNQRQILDRQADRRLDDAADIYFPIRRAFLLRAVLGCRGDDRLAIDRGVLAAFLETGRYLHGSRSLEKIATAFKQGSSHDLKRSGLPPAEVMSMHADPEEFMWIVNRSLPYKVDSGKLAPAIHEYYRQEGKKQGWTMPYDVDYAALPGGVQGDNLAAAARIPEVIELIGLYAVPRQGPKACPRREVDRLIEQDIEVLAEAEHDGWMDHKKRNGWTLGPRDDARRVHPDLVPYSQLSEQSKNKDRNSVRAYPAILALAGYKIVNAPPRG